VLKRRRLLITGLMCGIALLLSGCKFVLLDPKGMIAADEKRIMLTSILLMLIVVLPVIFLAFAIAWRYRESNKHATYAPEWSHNLLLEIIWWSIPCAIIATLATITWISSHRLDPYKPLAVKGEPLEIDVIALRWKWLFIYPKQTIATVNFIQFPVNVPVRFMITAEGPMNSFQIPQLGGQIYAMAGMQTKLHLIANAVGDYDGISANFSGDGFSDMKFIARVTTKAQFDQWVKTVKQSKATLTSDAYNQLVVPSIKHPQQSFSAVNKTIFETVVMKTMMPMTEGNIK